MSNSKLATYTKLSPNCTKPRGGKIRKITIHHMAGNLSVERCGEIFADKSRQASSNYGVGTDGRIGLYVDEVNRAWTSSNADNDDVAVTIEVANDGGAPDWHVSDKVLMATIDLCADICKRNGIEALNFTGGASGNLTMHKYFTPTACPGPYLESKFPYIAEQVNKRLQEGTKAEKTLYRVQAGAFKEKANADKQLAAIKKAGFTDAILVKADGLYKVQVGAYAEWSNASKMLRRIKNTGYNAFITEKAGTMVISKKSNKEIAKEVIAGKWGNGAERTKRLTIAGYDPEIVQAYVNEMLS